MKGVIIALVLLALIVGALLMRSPAPNATSPFASDSTAARTVQAPVEIEVFGMVRSPGRLMLSTGSMSEALKRTAPYILSDLKRVRVFRIEAGVRAKDVILDVSGVMDGSAKDIQLESGDVVYVPEKIL